MFYLYINIYWKNYLFSITLKAKILFVLTFLLAQTLSGQSSLNVTLLDNWQDEEIITNSSELRYNDCWGYVQSGIEYAVLGSTEGIHFFEIKDNNTFQFIEFIEGKFSSTAVVHRDIKIYNNFLYAVCDEGESSLQIIDLSGLPNSVTVVAENDTTFSKVHNIFIDEANNLMYACAITPMVNGIQSSLVPMQVYSLANPVNPVLLYTGPSDIPEIHDAFVRDNVAYLNCGFDGLRIYDFSDPSNPIFLQNESFYQEQGYNHQGWMTPDGKTFVFADETYGKKVKKCSINSDHTINIEQYFGTNSSENSVPHNIMLDNNFAFVAYYNEGLRIYNLDSSPIEEIGHYDTYPSESPFKMNGAWGVYSELPSGRILVSDRENGLFLLGFDRSVFTTAHEGEVTIYPSLIENNTPITIKINNPEISSFVLDIIDLNGKVCFSQGVTSSNYFTFQGDLSKGLYSIRVQYLDYVDDLYVITKKIVVY